MTGNTYNIIRRSINFVLKHFSDLKILKCKASDVECKLKPEVGECKLASHERPHLCIMFKAMS